VEAIREEVDLAQAAVERVATKACAGLARLHLALQVRARRRERGGGKREGEMARDSGRYRGKTGEGEMWELEVGRDERRAVLLDGDPPALQTMGDQPALALSFLRLLLSLSLSLSLSHSLSHSLTLVA